MQSFISNSVNADISLIEGNRGLFDGFDLNGCCSTAELGKILNAPVIIIADVTMSTRTIAALIMGCQRFDPDLNIVGVILNRVAGSRHESIVRNSIEQYCGIPVLGSVPKLRGNVFPERHMGLVPQQERDHAEKAISWARKVVEENLDPEAIVKLANDADPLVKGDLEKELLNSNIVNKDTPTIGFIRDGSFWFYYPENLEQLKKLGAKLVEVNSITDKKLPQIDALYIGGGFPETQAKALADNKGFRDSVKQRIETGLPVYAECGGLMYLGESLLVAEKTFPMVGALPLKFLLENKPQGHGYTILEVTNQNPYYQVGETLKGHEFHYSRPLMSQPEAIKSVFKVCRGNGLDGERDGLCKKNLLATYTHIHSGGYPLWGERFFNVALHLKNNKKSIFFDDSEKEGLTI
jgi:cobyrinic acid a,c-diamide synthase